MNTEQENNMLSFFEKIDQNSEEFRLLSGIDNFLKDLEQRFSITEEQRIILDGEMTGFIIQKPALEECLKNIHTHLLFSTDEETVGRIVMRVKDFLTKEEKDIPAPVAAPSPNEALKSIQERLVTPIGIPPAQHNQSMGPTESVPESNKKLDPYRESVE